MSARLWSVTVLALTGMWVIAANSQRIAPLERITLQVGIRSIQAEVARDDADTGRGLMHRKTLAKDGGMLFVFPKPTQHCFWMKDTLIPLSIAFIDGHGLVINVEDMDPQSEQDHCSAGPSQYALEVNQGLFQAAAVTTGTKITGLPVGQ